MKKILSCAFVFFFLACGYVPTSQIAKTVFEDKIYIHVKINEQDPRNSVFIIDTLRELVINKLGKTPVSLEEADDIINVEVNNLSFRPIVYDENGYVISYQAKLLLSFSIEYKDGSKELFTTSGSYDFAISPNSVISDTARLEAIRFASNEAFDEFISYIAIKGHKSGKYQ